MKKLFNDAGDFAAMRAAEKWLDQRGFSVGTNQRGSPRGILYGAVHIAKWRNLSPAERDDLHGTMTGDMRNGPVCIEIGDDVLRTYEVPA